MGQGIMDSTNKKGSRVKETVRRSSRISKQAKPTPGLLAAKKNAMKSLNKKQAEFSFIKDIYQAAREAKEMVIQETGLVYDNKMTQHECLWDPEYPESPQRLTSIYNRCNELGLIEKCKLIEPRLATEAEILTCHSCDLINLLKSTRDSKDLAKLEEISSHFDSIYIHPTTYECSLLAAGCTLQLIDEICNNKIQNGMAIVRPPGHHAMVEEYNGYCFFNNVCLGAKRALALGLKRVLIVDWDVHHGQGTQKMFYNDPRVLYVSIHRYDRGTFWPKLRLSEFDYIGEGRGAGYNVNIPLNSTGMSDADYLAAFHQVILKIAYQFQPELVLVSAGFDSAVGDIKGEMEVSPACYAHLVSSLMSIANGKVAVVLEGGYCLKSLAEGAALTLRSLLGEPCPRLGPLPPPCLSMEKTLFDVISVLREYWGCLKVLGEFTNMGELISDKEEIIWEYGHKQRLHRPIPRYENTEENPKIFPTRDCYPIQPESIIRLLDNKIENLKSSTKLFSAPYKVSFVYDVRMMEHKNFAETDHIEKPQRISSIFNMHKEYDLLDRLLILQSRLATEDELKSAHSKNHIINMQGLSSLSNKELLQKRKVFLSVYFHQESYNAASLAAGCLLQVVDSVLKGESRSGVAVVRPPGHHADIDDPCGFCIFNSVAVAARYAISNYKLQRVLIVDWDVHHGNGTQEIFFEDSNVLYISVHRFDKGDFFPNSGDGAASLVGRSDGLGFNVNIPWNQGGMGNAEYVSAFHQIVLPIAYQFDPELVLISAGFDAAVGDPLGGCKVTPEAFGHMTHWLKPLANGRVILSLEGGYNVNSISYSMTMCTKALLGDPLPPLKDIGPPCLSALRSLREVAYAQAEYWPCVRMLKARLPEIASPNGGKSPPPKNEDGTCDLMGKLRLSDSGGREEGGGGGSDDKKTEGTDPPSSGANQPDDQLSQPSGSNQSQRNEASDAPTLRSFLQANLEALQNEEMFAVIPLRTCPHLPEVNPVPSSGINTASPCSACQDPTENWICLTCYQIHCGRYVNEHMLLHNAEENHSLTLSFSDLSVWCYPCQSYIDNPVLYDAKNAVHVNKFGSPLAWSYGTMPSSPT